MDGSRKVEILGVGEALGVGETCGFRYVGFVKQKATIMLIETKNIKIIIASMAVFLFKAIPFSS